MFAISYSAEAAQELSQLRAHDRALILDEIGRHLKGSPGSLSRKRKRIVSPDGRFIYQLRVGEFRVFYDIGLKEKAVVIRHVRRKGRKTTEEVL